MIPSHMFQLRVECVACHVAPKEAGETAGFVGRTFRPSERACLDCHGERYRGMLDRWTETLATMGKVVDAKLEVAKAALGAAGAKGAKERERARALVADAEFNLHFVSLGKGVHNVFYAADLLKLANGWLDEAAPLLGARPPKVDDVLVRGGYCGVLCHEQAGVKLPEVVTFEKQRVPHARHTTEFGAVCTSCHSAEVHTAVTAKSATCASCHHGAQNDRCESCHRVQSAFYRGESKTSLAKLEPNVMANAVGCTGCHDLSVKHSAKAVGAKCVACHDAGYTSFLDDWTTEVQKDAAKTAEAIKRAEAALARERRARRANGQAEALLREARESLALVRKARGVHNPEGAGSLLEASRQRAEAAMKALTRR